MTRIVCFGPGPRFKGGIANYNTSLAKAFDRFENLEVHIISWTQQYPAIIPRDFIDRKSRADQLEGTRIKVHYLTNYNRPSSWQKTIKFIRRLQPDLVVMQWAIAVQGIPLGYIAKRLAKTQIRIVFDLHFVIQKEGSKLDNRLTKLGISSAYGYLVHAGQTADQLKTLFPKKQLQLIAPEQTVSDTKATKVIRLFHPVYDMFKPDPDFDKQAEKNKLGLRKHVFLFFGFIRKYKGLHQAIEAFARLAQERDDISLLIVGESFWQTLDTKKVRTKVKKALFDTAKKLVLKKQDDEQNYQPLNLIKQLAIEDKTVVVNEFVPNEEVHRYFQVSDNLLLFYLTATPSGVESIGYNFQMPMLATRVGHFPETVIDGFNGYLAKDGDIEDMKICMLKAIKQPIDRQNITKTAENMSWESYAKEIIRHFIP
ncbi:MAG: glycosyltransferase [Bacteroidales bacterium]|jgi:glycosyltransferase involved in cell wall biosynthesis|nr:glycosyltransferase [Bacteroidales bacterium]MDY0369262.1 glycosyltransferase [Bacteroidales bacterium]